MSGNKVLVVDDEELNRDLAVRVLNRAGFDCASVDNGKDAYRFALTNKPDIILLDIMMPEIDGIQVLKALKKNSETAGIPVFMLTAVSEKEVVRKCITLGAHDYILKPLHAEDVIKRIHTILGNTPPESDAPPAEPKESAKSIVEELSDRLKNDQLEFTAMPKLGQEIIERLKDENTPLESVSSLIEKEAGMAAKIIKASNTVNFAAAKPCIHPKEAIIRIGIKRTLNYVLLISTLPLFQSDVPLFKKVGQELLTHSITAAVCAREIARLAKLGDIDQVYALALFHDIGKLILIRILSDLYKHRPIEDAETLDKVLTTLHTKFGASILKRWKFPAPFVEAAQLHHDEPDRHKHSKATIIVILSNILTHAMENLYELQVKKMENHPCVTMLGISVNGLLDLPEIVESELRWLEAILND